MRGDYRTHLHCLGEGERTLCGLGIKQAHGKLPLGNPWTIDCRNCLSLYYLQNPFPQIKDKWKAHA